MFNKKIKKRIEILENLNKSNSNKIQYLSRESDSLIKQVCKLSNPPLFKEGEKAMFITNIFLKKEGRIINKPIFKYAGKEFFAWEYDVLIDNDTKVIRIPQRDLTKITEIEEKK